MKKRNILKKRTIKEKRKSVRTLMIIEKEQLRKHERKGTKVMRDSLGNDELEKMIRKERWTFTNFR